MPSKFPIESIGPLSNYFNSLTFSRIVFGAHQRQLHLSIVYESDWHRFVEIEFHCKLDFVLRITFYRSGAENTEAQKKWEN